MDTGAFYALADADDEHHDEAIAVAAQLRSRRLPAFTTAFVVAESHALLLARLGPDAARTWLARLSVPIEPVETSDWSRATDMVRQHTDKDYTLTDALSFAVMARTGATDAFAFDRHFHQAGFRLHRAKVSVVAR
ncbi:MAG: type II toxin-antitoxin system VapC family toxin [Deltaproteobacteria bacterium]|nr:type II toxin-antitoxin system VapC family toxin [Deltaproteobacteria bacterium]